MKRIVACLGLVVSLAGCPGPSKADGGMGGGVGGGTGGGSDGGSTGPLLRAHTGDGQELHVYFSEETQVTTDDVKVLDASGMEVSAKVSGVTPDAADSKHVVVMLDSALPKTVRYQVSVAQAGGDAAKVPLKGTLSLALVWHQHQPSYVDPEGDWLRGPWVRKHGTKSYYDMAAMVGQYPDVHLQVNLTPILLMQLETYYIDRLKPYVDVSKNTVDTAGYFAQRPGLVVTDPWLDMLLKPTPAPANLTETEKGYFYRDIWSNFSISDVMINRWPDYKDLRTKRDNKQAFTQDELLQMKGYFQLAWFDPSFLAGPVTLPDGNVVNLSDLVKYELGTYTLKRPFTEADCQRLVVEEYKVLSNVIAVHKKFAYDADKKTGQIEVMTTPFYHPILPLLVDTDVAKQGLPGTPMPMNRYQQAKDAEFHVAQAARTHQQRLGRAVTGMWPAEGSVAENVVKLFADKGVKWIATDRKVLERSASATASIYTPYRIDADTVAGDDGDTTDELAIVFRDTSISDKIGFHYQGGTGKENVADFLESLRKHAPDYGEERLLSVILDGENAWESYSLDNDAVEFLGGMYQALTDTQKIDEFRSVTVSEYLSGNPARKVAAHPIHDLPELEPLFPASWIAGSFSTWIGEEEENIGWDYLHKVRADLTTFEGQGLARPALDANPAVNSKEWHQMKAWEAMYAAEGSDWFWWYGDDQTAAGGDGPFDRIYLELLKSVYRHAKAAGINTNVPDFVPILRVCKPSTGAMTAGPNIDGQFNPDDGNNADNPNEWTQNGSGVCVDVDSGASANPDDVIKTFYTGQDKDNVYLALRLSADAKTRLGADWTLRLYFSHRHIVALGPPVQAMEDPKATVTFNGQPIKMQAGGAAREIALRFTSQGAIATSTLATANGTGWNAASATANVEAKLGSDVLELKVPKATLNYQSGDPLEVLITAISGGAFPGEVDRAPNLTAAVIHADRSKMVEVTFIVDCTGSQLALDAVKPIQNPPPPKGTGKVFIVGSLPELGNWSPNTVAMSDDGTTLGDAKANDNLWTFRMLVPPMTLGVGYKYTIGSMGDGWSPTEEYPLTNRGLEVADKDGNSKMVIKDVFADRPDPSGSVAKMTVISDP